MAMAVAVPSKQVTPYAITELKRFIYETGRTQAILQCDRESSIMNLLKEVAKDIGGLTVRYIPTSSSQSNGSFERCHATLLGQVRTLRMALLIRLGLDQSAFQTTHALFPWVIKHAA